MIRNFEEHGFSKTFLAAKEQDAETFTIEIQTDPVENIWETYKARVVRGWYKNGQDHWDVWTSVDKANGDAHWRYLSERRNGRRMAMVINCIRRELKRAAA